jgi:hypothetical protein
MIALCLWHYECNMDNNRWILCILCAHDAWACFIQIHAFKWKVLVINREVSCLNLPYKVESLCDELLAIIVLMGITICSRVTIPLPCKGSYLHLLSLPIEEIEKTHT